MKSVNKGIFAVRVLYLSIKNKRVVCLTIMEGLYNYEKRNTYKKFIGK